MQTEKQKRNLPVTLAGGVGGWMAGMGVIAGSTQALMIALVLLVAAAAIYYTTTR